MHCIFPMLKYHASKAHGGYGIKLHVLLTSALGEGEWSA